MRMIRCRFMAMNPDVYEYFYRAIVTYDAKCRRREGDEGLAAADWFRTRFPRYRGLVVSINIIPRLFLVLLSDSRYRAIACYKKQRVHSSDASYKNYPCPNCPSVFAWKYTLKRHLRNECGKEPRFKCPYCDYRGKWKANICRHIKRVHKDRGVYVLTA